MSTTPEQPVYYLNFTSTCQHCRATVRTVDGETQPHECENTNVTSDTNRWTWVDWTLLALIALSVVGMVLGIVMQSVTR